MATLVSSVHAQVCDLLGYDPARCDPVAGRPSLGEAIAAAKPGEVIAARHGRERLALAVLADGRAFSVPDACPHDGGLLSTGYLEGEHLVCARHGWEFDLITGKAVNRQCRSLASCPRGR